MSPGNLDRRIRIMYGSEAIMPSGESQTIWAEVATVFAQIVQPWKGSRSPRDGAESRNENLKTIFVRWFPALAPGSVLSNIELHVAGTGERYRIISSSEFSGRRAYLNIEAELITEALR